MLERLAAERKALSLLMLGFYTTVFSLAAINMEGAWRNCFSALALTYGVAFFALAARWFWARWFAMGIGLSGMTMAAIGMFSLGPDPGLLIWGGMHLLIYLPLWGEAMADLYENQPAWRQRYGMDEDGVHRLKRAVNSAATGLPTLILFTLAPRQGSMAHLAVLLLACAGVFGLVRLRVWGLALLGLSAAWLAAAGLQLLTLPAATASAPLLMPGLALCAALFFALSVTPFLLPAYRFLRR